MILKVSTRDGWAIFDNIDHVEYSPASSKKYRARAWAEKVSEGDVCAVDCGPKMKLEIRDSKTDAAVNDLPNVGIFHELSLPHRSHVHVSDNWPKEGCKYVVRVGAMRRDGSKLEVFCESGYLLDDEGKTIESLNK